MWFAASDVLLLLTNRLRLGLSLELKYGVQLNLHRESNKLKFQAFGSGNAGIKSGLSILHNGSCAV